ncbi:MAG TPA: hypothetical protein VMW73_06630 [Spirochaetia bacterium]|nr:hypothetical protein [Spirochaetia bacterium]
MRKALYMGSLLAALTLILASCGSPSLLVPAMQEQNAVTINTLTNGSIVSTGAQIPIRLEYSDSYKQGNKLPDSMQIHLLAADGTEIRTFAIGADLLATQDSFNISLPELPTGQYTLDLKVYQSGKMLQEKSVQFFHVQGTYSVTGISTYPSSFYPGSSGLLQAHLDVPAGSDPYLRWTMNDKVIAQGVLSAGFDQTLLQAPSVEGAYNVTVELFPLAPVGSTTFAFSSPIKQTTEVFVSRSQNADANELGPATSYYSLFHFRGDYRDDGVRVSMRDGRAPAAVPVGNPDLRINGSIFGYHLDGTSGFAVGEVILPFSGGTLSPFSMTMRAMADTKEQERTLFAATSADGAFAFSVQMDSAGNAIASISHNGQTGSVSSNQIMFTPGEPSLVSVSVVPGVSSTEISWFRDGAPLSSGTVSVGFGTAPKDTSSWTIVPGKSTIGGPSSTGSKDGFVGIVDEFGIYFRDTSLRPSTDSAIYAAAMEQKFGTSLVYAEGFEGSYLPAGVETHGSVTLKDGDLVLAPGSDVTFPRFMFERQDLVVDVSVDRKAQTEHGDMQFIPVGTTPDSSPILSINTDGTIRVPENVLVSVQNARGPVLLSSLPTNGDGEYLLTPTEPLHDPIEIRFSHGESNLVVGVGGTQLALRMADPTFGGVRMKLALDSSRSVAFRVHDLLARKDGGNLTSSLIQSKP